MGQQIVDWSVLSEPGVMDAIANAAGKVASRYSGAVERSDLLQEAYIAVATHPGQYRAYVTDEDWGYFSHALVGDLTHVANRMASHSNNVVSLDQLADQWSEVS